MRFRWVPVTVDSVYPFLIGLLEFLLIETLGPEKLGLWLIIMAMVFALMNWVSHMTVRRCWVPNVASDDCTGCDQWSAYFPVLRNSDILGKFDC